jgi:hypothetical protein
MLEVPPPPSPCFSRKVLVGGGLGEDFRGWEGPSTAAVALRKGRWNGIGSCESCGASFGVDSSGVVSTWIGSDLRR